MQLLRTFLHYNMKSKLDTEMESNNNLIVKIKETRAHLNDQSNKTFNHSIQSSRFKKPVNSEFF